MIKSAKSDKGPSQRSRLGPPVKPNKRAIGDRLQRARNALGLTQQQLAEKLGAGLQTVQSWEAGRRLPRGEFASGYARLGVNLHWAMEGEGSMLLEGAARQVQLELRDSASGDYAAGERLQRRVDRAMDGFKDAQRLVDDAAARCGYEMPQLVRQAIVLAVMKGMAPDAIDTVLQMLKAQALLDLARPSRQNDPGLL